jgi:hypothetical protein
MRIIIGIDDTDNLESRGTGHLARQLALCIEKDGLAEVDNITRHQLLVHPLIPYTSHNSSASLLVSATGDLRKLIEFCRSFLLKESAAGSDSGLCVSALEAIQDEIKVWGERAKLEILQMSEAVELASRHSIYLEGLTGERTGIIGSLAAVGLRARGNDGRILWLRNLRELTGTHMAGELQQLLAIDRICTLDNESVPTDSLIHLTEWTRPIVRDNCITLLVQETDKYENCRFTVASKEFIKSITE